MNISVLRIRQHIALCAIVLALLGGLSACTVITTETQTTALTRSGGWKFDSFPVGTAPASVATAYTGSSIQFSADGTFQFTNGAGGKSSGTWSWSSLTVLAINSGAGTDTWEVPELSSTTMRWSGTLSGGDKLEVKWSAK